MAEEESGEKSHEPSQKKLQDARKKGEVPRSVDVTTAASYGGLLLAILAFGAGSVTSLGTVLMTFLEQPGTMRGLLDSGGGSFRGALFARIAGGVAPWFAVPAGVALVALLAQRSLVFAPSKLAPKLSRISPISTAKQKFGRAGLFEFLKSFAKLMLYSVVLGIYLSAQLPRILVTMMLSPGQGAAELARLATGLLVIVLVIAAALGVIDAVFQHAEHIRKNRMSRKEMTEEMKQSEGDPAMKQKRRDKAVSLAMQQMLADVPEASVVITNPTHFAVALKWDRSAPGAPVCVAKGADHVAARIREVAAENGVPLHADPPTARALHAGVEIGEEIRAEHYRAVAAAIRFAEEMRTKARNR